jgi:hypothetical protein
LETGARKRLEMVLPPANAKAVRTIAIKEPINGCLSCQDAGSGRQRQEAQAWKATLLLIERGDTHEIRNTGTTPLKTLNFYVPPAYNSEGDELPAGKPK